MTGSVWAPTARTVDLVLPAGEQFSAADARVAMVRDPERTGWWSPPGGPLRDGDRYGFSVEIGRASCRERVF